jgi:hypothetical protein
MSTCDECFGNTVDGFGLLASVGLRVCDPGSDHFELVSDQPARLGSGSSWLLVLAYRSGLGAGPAGPAPGPVGDDGVGPFTDRCDHRLAGRGLNPSLLALG